MFYIKTIFLVLYIILGLYPLSIMVAAAVGSHPQLVTISSMYTLFWFVIGGVALIRPRKYVKYFIAINLVAFLYISYKLIPDVDVIVLYVLRKGHTIRPGTQLYYRMESIVPPLWFLIGLASEGVVSYLLFKKSMVKDGRPNKSLNRDAA